MATGGTVPPVAITNPSHSLPDLTDSNMSSPLSEVEDNTNDSDDMDIDLNSNHFDHEKPTADEHSGGGGSLHALTDDSGSNLSDLDVNDSEAETERLYDSPRKTNIIRDTDVTSKETSPKPSSDRRDRVFERSPSKLQQQIQADVDAEMRGDGDSEPTDDHDNTAEHDEDHEDHDHALTPSTETHTDKEDGEDHKPDSQSSRSKSQESHIIATSTVVEDHSDNPTKDTRKRKRSPLADSSEVGQPLRKRTGSTAEPDHKSLTPDKAAVEEEEQSASAGDKSGEHSGEEEAQDAMTKEGAEELADSVEKPVQETGKSRKSKRNNGKKRKGLDEEVHDEVPPDTEETVDDHEHAVDEEAEAQHRNEEELERKRTAFEQLASIEKHFTAFRERLYEERVAQLNDEEAMLTAEHPTHPEYLAMMQCIDARRDERLRVADVEYKLNMGTLERWAVARRAQILSQYYQSIRETREKTLDELGRQWYEIQHERRRHANITPDFGFPFPKTGAQQKMQAIAQNKETSILSGIAQHKGFPAAPDLKGATPIEVDDDLDAINRARHASLHAAQPMAFQEYGSVTFGRSLGPAGEQFLEQTPWANPNHPSHQNARQPSQQQTYAGPSGSRRHSTQAATHMNNQMNGDAARKYTPVRLGKATAAELKSKRESIAQS